MGKAARERPDRLADKLRNIRLRLGLSQSEMLRRLGFEDEISYSRISEYENDIREPTLRVLLQYARVAGICADVLIDDEAELPDALPASRPHDYRGKRRG